MEFSYLLISTILGLCVGLAAGIWFTKRRTVDTVDSIKEEVDRLKKDALAEAERLRKEARIQGQEETFQLKKEAEKEIKEWKVELRGQEGRLKQKEQQVNRKYELVDDKEIEVLEKEKALQQLDHTLEEKGKEINGLVNKQRSRLEKISGMSVQEAKDCLLDTLEADVRQDAAKLIKKIETETKDTAEKRSKEIISLAVARYAGEYIAERTVSVVHLPSDEMKGRIIGREGRNIRAMEAATGIDLIIDDTPEAVLLSGFNSVRREVARIALERLIADGRIHPARIEEVVKKVEKEIDNTIRETGEQAAFDIGAYGIHAELIKLLGKLRFRTSYAQNVLQHSIEVAFLCGIMASELGV
ncbi:MAG: Rnase Y domain-containing protein, partial [Thermodesulfobacteriota bacterium]|nr:Rnase Y domain-containing protein [Thermodesulfobacteriota bacterium]